MLGVFTHTAHKHASFCNEIMLWPRHMPHEKKLEAVTVDY
jgi:hypothetical protein